MALAGAFFLQKGDDDSAEASFRFLASDFPKNLCLLEMLWQTNDKLGRQEAASKYRRRYKIAKAEQATGLKYQD